jgi:hypothetical protein
MGVLSPKNQKKSRKSRMGGKKEGQQQQQQGKGRRGSRSLRSPAPLSLAGAEKTHKKKGKSPKENPKISTEC